MSDPNRTRPIRRTSGGAIDLDHYRNRARDLRSKEAGRLFGRMIGSLSEHTNNALKVLGTISAAYVTPRT